MSKHRKPVLSRSRERVTETLEDAGSTISSAATAIGDTFGKIRRVLPGADDEKSTDGDATDGDRRGDGDRDVGHVVVEDLPDDLKECYVQTLVWLVHGDDDRIDARELCEIQVLMAQLRCSARVRQSVRSSLEDPSGLDPEELTTWLLDAVPTAEARLALSCSLLKDAIRIRRATSGGRVGERPGILRLAAILDLDDDKVAFIEETCVQDQRILDGEISDRQIKKAMKATAARAASVGVPVAAVYLSGSVVGLSAAGITSGLATLGLGGVLGLSAMATGIGVVILVGGTAYKAAQWVMGGAERDRGSRRELMLQEVLRIHQMSIVNLAEDIAAFGARVAALTDETKVNREAIRMLARKVTLLIRSTGALGELGVRARGFERALALENEAPDSRVRGGRER